MLTRGEESILTILQQFDDEPISIRAALEKMGLDKLRNLTCGLGSIPNYIANELTWNRTVEKTVTGYVITKRGEFERDRLLAQAENKIAA